MKLLFDLKFLTILYKNYQFDTIPFQNEIIYDTLYFSFLQAFSLNFLNVADFCNHIKKKIEYDYQKMTLYYLKEYKGVFNERI